MKLGNCKDFSFLNTCKKRKFMKVNSINSFSSPQSNRIKKLKNPSFGSEYEINGDTIVTRQQIFTMGMLMNNFWMYDAKNTFLNVKLKHVYGKFNIKVNDARDFIVERILDRNRIEYKKLDKKPY